MFRSIKTLIALCALVTAAACNNVAGPDGTERGSANGPAVGDRNAPDGIASPDQMTPGEGEGGGGSGVKEPVKEDPTRRVRRDPADLSPVDGESSGGDEVISKFGGERRTRPGQEGRHTP